VGACWSDAATLSFKSDTAIPFAVRLNEIVLGPDKKTLQVKVTGFKLPNTALGGEDVAATVRDHRRMLLGYRCTADSTGHSDNGRRPAPR
jgi:hypothetical protein